MLISKLLGERLKEKPNDASVISHIFLVRGGYVRQVSNGIYSMLPPAKKIEMKIEKIIREEMDGIGGQEVLFPVVMPAELWEESGRYKTVGSELMRMKDRAGHDMLLGMTHEEAAVHLARNEALSYAKYPFMIYQIQTKFRDEPRSRGGLIRVREFTMKDAYSFHTTQDDLEAYYKEVYDAYHRIFTRVGLPEVISVGSDTGMMGGKVAHEYMLLTDAGEDTIVICEHCGYRANMEIAVARVSHAYQAEEAVAEVHTPGIKDIDSLALFFNVHPSKLMKATIFAVGGSPKPLVVFIRGDLQVNESKLKRAIKADIFPLTADTSTDLTLGYVGAIGLDTEKIDVIFDVSLEGETNLICGANKENYHLKGVSISRDLGTTQFFDVAKVGDDADCAICGSKLSLHRGIEVGNIFQLGTKYTESMNMTYIDSEGSRRNPVMGCYGIGIGRMIACLIEANHDEYGPIWPMSVSPWQVHICMLNATNPEVRSAGLSIYEKLSDRFDVILDDRDVVAGIQFADADLLGVPIRMIVSKRNLDKAEVEITTRNKSVRMNVALDSAEAEVSKLIAEYGSKFKKGPNNAERQQ